MKKITVYSSTSCPHCIALKAYLKSGGIEFEDKDVQENMAFKKELIDKGYRGVPVVIIDDIEVVGFDREKLDNILK